MSDSFADEPATAETPDDMPLVWPILDEADAPGAGQALQTSVRSRLLVTLIAGALAALAAMIVRALFNRSTAGRQRKPRTTRPRRPISPAFAGWVAAARFAQAPSPRPARADLAWLRKTTRHADRLGKNFALARP